MTNPSLGDKVLVSVDDLAQIIRRVDGNHSLGAGELAEAILASLDLSPAELKEEGAGHGYVFQNPDTGTEYSANHPVESGEVEDAYDVRPATEFEDHLVAELRNAKTTIGTLTESLNATSQNYSSAYNRAEAAEDKFRTVSPVPEPQAVAWRYRYKTDRTGDAWDEWMVVTVDPNDWDWPPAWHDFECQPLYAALSSGSKT